MSKQIIFFHSKNLFNMSKKAENSTSNKLRLEILIEKMLLLKHQKISYWKDLEHP